jgi:glycosyltransferase involved in cell wall biosynthesis
VKVIHCHNLAGVPSTLAKYQNQLGLDSLLIVRRDHPFGFPEEKLGKYRGIMKLLDADLVHYHSASWVEKLPILRVRNPDARLLSLLGKPLVLHYHGDDLRKGLFHPHFKPAHTFVSTPDLLAYAPESEWLPNPVDLEVFHPTERPPDPVHRVGYYQSPGGSEYVPAREIEQAVAKLRSRFRVETLSASGLRHDEMPRYYHSLTVWVDKLNGGFYGLMACEAAVSGVPVIASTSRIRGHLNREVFYEFTGNLADDLQYLLEDEEERRRIAQKGWEYVRDRHDAEKVTKRTIEIYRSL